MQKNQQVWTHRSNSFQNENIIQNKQQSAENWQAAVLWSVLSHGNQFLNDGFHSNAAGDCGQAGSAWRKGIVKGNKLFPLTNVAIRENCNLEEKTFAVRHIKTKRDRQCEI